MPPMTSSMTKEEEEALRWTISDLKQQAVRSKQDGDVPTALRLLRQAKGLEAAAVREGLTPTEMQQQQLQLPPQYWERLAVLRGREQEEAPPPPAPAPPPPPAPAAAPAAAVVASATETTPTEPTSPAPTSSPTSSPATPAARPKERERQDEEVVENNEEEHEEEDVERLLEERDGGDRDTHPDDDAASTWAFTDEEMGDLDVMVDLCEMDMTVPSDDEYAARVLHHKKAALESKRNGDLPAATQRLRTAKRLEEVRTALLPHRRKGGGEKDAAPTLDPEQWMGSLNAEESELLGELFREAQTVGGGGGGGGGIVGDDDDDDDGGGWPADGNDPSSSTAAGDGGDVGVAALTCDELEGMDVSDLYDFVDVMGRPALPTNLERDALHQQQLAVQAKQQGDIATAKARLVESKKLKLQAQKVAAVLDRLDRRSGGGGQQPSEVDLDDLEALVSGGGAKKKNKATVMPPAPAAVAQPTDPWLSRPSTEIKLEVLRLKNDKQVKEATRLLHIFKQVLHQEQRVAEERRCAALVGSMQERLDDCAVQIRLWQVYQWFVDTGGDDDGTPHLGEKQYELWTTFASRCEHAIRAIQAGGSAAAILTPVGPETEVKDREQLYTLDDEMIDLVERGMSSPKPSQRHSLGGDLEIAVLGAFHMHENEKLQKILRQKEREQGKGLKGSDSNPDAGIGGTPPAPVVDEPCPFLRIEAKVQLPLNPDDPSQPTLLEYMPVKSQRLTTTSTTSSAPSLATFQYTFDPRSADHSRHRVKVARGDSRHARTLRKRFDTKTVQFTVYQTQQRPKGSNNNNDDDGGSAKPKSSSSWFFGGGGGGEKNPATSGGDDDDAGKRDTILGKVTVELRPLLTRNCIVGDYPLLVNNRPTGGILRICLRTDLPLNDELYEGVGGNGAATESEIHPTRYGKEVIFSFPNVDTTSGASAKS